MRAEAFALWPESAVWCGPPLETLQAWQVGLGGPAGPPGTLALVHWHQGHALVLRLQDGRCLRYASAPGRVDLLPAGARFEQDLPEAGARAADVIPLEANRLAQVGASGELAQPLLQLDDEELLQSLAMFGAHWQAEPPLAAGKLAADVLLRHIALQLAVDPRAVTATGFSAPQRERIWQIICGHLGGELPMEALLQQLPHRRQAFAAAFKASFGTTVRQFTLDRRIDTARYLLIRTELPLTRIAMATGFASPSHFSTAFAARVGCVPSVYRAARPRAMKKAR